PRRAGLEPLALTVRARTRDQMSFIPHADALRETVGAGIELGESGADAHDVRAGLPYQSRAAGLETVRGSAHHARAARRNEHRNGERGHFDESTEHGSLPQPGSVFAAFCSG